MIRKKEPKKEREDLFPWSKKKCVSGVLARAVTSNWDTNQGTNLDLNSPKYQNPNKTTNTIQCKRRAYKVSNLANKTVKQIQPQMPLFVTQVYTSNGHPNVWKYQTFLKDFRITLGAWYFQDAQQTPCFGETLNLNLKRSQESCALAQKQDSFHKWIHTMDVNQHKRLHQIQYKQKQINSMSDPVAKIDIQL